MFRSAWKNYHGSYQKVMMMMMMMIMIMILIMMMTVMMMMTMMMMMLMPWVWILPRPAHEVWLSLVGRSSCRWRRLILSFSFFLYHSHIFSYSFYIILIYFIILFISFSYVLILTKLFTPSNQKTCSCNSCAAGRWWRAEERGVQADIGGLPPLRRW